MSVTLIHSKKYDLQKGNCYITLTNGLLKIGKNLLPFLWVRTWFSKLANKQNSWITIVIWK